MIDPTAPTPLLVFFTNKRCGEHIVAREILTMTGMK